jgi:hypothetical protein
MILVGRGVSVVFRLGQTVFSKTGLKAAGKATGKVAEKSAAFTGAIYDRAISTANFTMTLHNAVSTSTNIIQSADLVVANMLKLMKDPNVNDKVVSGGITRLLEGVFGKNLWTAIKYDWQKLQVVYNATANSVNAVRGMSQQLNNTTGIVYEEVAQLKNALKEGGVVDENAYPWKAEEINTKIRFRDKLSGGVVATEALITGFAAVTSEMVNEQTELERINKEKEEALSDLVANGYKEKELKASLPAVLEDIKKEFT